MAAGELWAMGSDPMTFFPELGGFYYELSLTGVRIPGKKLSECFSVGVTGRSPEELATDLVLEHDQYHFQLHGNVPKEKLPKKKSMFDPNSVFAPLWSTGKKPGRWWHGGLSAWSAQTSTDIEINQGDTVGLFIPVSPDFASYKGPVRGASENGHFWGDWRLKDNRSAISNTKTAKILKKKKQANSANNEAEVEYHNPEFIEPTPVVTQKMTPFLPGQIYLIHNGVVVGIGPRNVPYELGLYPIINFLDSGPGDGSLKESNPTSASLDDEDKNPVTIYNVTRLKRLLVPTFMRELEEVQLEGQGPIDPGLVYRSSLKKAAKTEGTVAAILRGTEGILLNANPTAAGIEKQTKTS